MSKKLSKERLLEWLSICIEDGLNLDEYALPGDREAYEQIKSLIENQPGVNEASASIPVAPITIEIGRIMQMLTDPQGYCGCIFGEFELLGKKWHFQAEGITQKHGDISVHIDIHKINHHAELEKEASDD